MRSRLLITCDGSVQQAYDCGSKLKGTQSLHLWNTFFLEVCVFFLHVSLSSSCLFS